MRVWTVLFVLADDHTDGVADRNKDGYTHLEEFLYRTDPKQFVDYRNPAQNIDSL